ncbi:MAG: hypothetical protein M1825_005635 [Sarcosagium campestre]|nr:MAG: hypothetical protein M1825_005635 [Sarcosagium campestre]
MGKQKKSTRKFEKNQLKDTLGRRKEFAKVKQRHRINDKKKTRRAHENGDDDAEDSKESVHVEVTKRETGGRDIFGNMSVDDFFKGGFELPEQAKTAGKKVKSNTVTKAGSKRKRDADPAEEEEEGDASSDESTVDEVMRDDSSSASGVEDDVDMHKEDLQALAEKDPEFYKYLKENDAELLDFSSQAGAADLGELSVSDTEVQPARKLRKQKASEALEIESDAEAETDDEDSNDVTMATVKKWTTAITEMHSLRAMREVVLAFRAAAHVNEEEGKAYKYTISDAGVYNELLLLTLRHIPEVLNHHLPLQESESGKIRVPTDSKKFRTLSPLLKSHTNSVQHLLSTLSDAATLKLTLSSIEPLLPYILSFKKLLKNLTVAIVEIWSDPSSTEATRVNAFLVIRRLASIGDAGTRETVFKALYQGLVKGSRNTTMHTMAGVNLMKNTAAELWGIDQSIGYTTGFAFIRQLAIHLRGSITNPTKESYKTIYNWQYVHSLDFWSRVLSVHCDPLQEATSAGKESAFRPLIYPVVQITLGALRLIPTAQYLPLRFQLTRSLLRLSRATGTYIPLAPSLLEVLHLAEMKKPPKPSTMKPLDFATTIRAPRSYLRTRTYQDGIGDQLAELLAEFFVLWSKSIAFPELALPVCVMLKRWLKEVSHKQTGNKNGKVNTAVSLVVQKLEANSRWIEERRASVDFAPNDRAGVEAFLKEDAWEKTPLGAFVVGARRQREERSKAVEAGRREEDRKRAEGREEDQRIEHVDHVSSDDDLS